MEYPDYVKYVMDILESIGHPAFLVGGCVRDMLLGKTPHDYDIVTSAAAGEIKACFDRVLTIGERYGTLGVLVGASLIEISSFRGRAGGDCADSMQRLADDLAGRDFTINAMALDLAGTLYDPWAGEADLKRGIIRATGGRGAQLFSDDPLRMLRAIRLHAVYGFNIENDTWQDIIQLKGLLVLCAPERIREEFNRILLSEQPAQGVRRLYQSGLLQYIIPELMLGAGFDQRSLHHDRDVFEHSLSALENTSPRLSLRLAALLHDVAKPLCFTLDEAGKGHFYGHHLVGSDMVMTIMGRLRYDCRTIEDVALLVGAHMSRFEKVRDRPLKKLIVQVGEHNLEDLVELQRADIIASAPPCNFTSLEQMDRDIRRILEEGLPLQRSDLAVKGDDLIALGYSPGPELGRTLMTLLEIVLDDPTRNKREILLEMASSRLASPASD